jgi:hypothetical protein
VVPHSQTENTLFIVDCQAKCYIVWLGEGACVPDTVYLQAQDILEGKRDTLQTGCGRNPSQVSIVRAGTRAVSAMVTDEVKIAFSYMEIGGSEIFLDVRLLGLWGCSLKLSDETL